MATQRKMFDFEQRKQAEQQIKAEETARKRSDVQAKNTERFLLDENHKESIARRIAEQQFKMQQDLEEKKEVMRVKANAQRERLELMRAKNEAITKSMQNNYQQQLLGKEMRHLRATKEREQASDLARKKTELKREFDKKRLQVLEKIKKLKAQGKGIEEIYKYTNDIIFEEDDEGDGLITSRDDDENPAKSDIPKLGSFTPEGIRRTSFNSGLRT